MNTEYKDIARLLSTIDLVDSVLNSLYQKCKKLPTYSYYKVCLEKYEETVYKEFTTYASSLTEDEFEVFKKLLKLVVSKLQSQKEIHFKISIDCISSFYNKINQAQKEVNLRLEKIHNERVRSASLRKF